MSLRFLQPCDVVFAMADLKAAGMPPLMAAIDNLVLLSFKKNDRKRLPAEGERYLEKLSRYQTDTCLARRQVATTLREWLWQALASDEYGNLSGPSLNYLLTLSSVHIFSELLAATLVQPSASMQASTRLLAARLGKRRSAFALSEKSLMNMQVRHPEAPEVLRRSSSFSIHAALLLLSTEPSPQARASNTRSLPGRRFALPGEVKRNGHNSTDAQHDYKHTCTCACMGKGMCVRTCSVQMVVLIGMVVQSSGQIVSCDGQMCPQSEYFGSPL